MKLRRYSRITGRGSLLACFESPTLRTVDLTLPRWQGLAWVLTLVLLAIPTLGGCEVAPTPRDEVPWASMRGTVTQAVSQPGDSGVQATDQEANFIADLVVMVQYGRIEGPGSPIDFGGLVGYAEVDFSEFGASLDYFLPRTELRDKAGCAFSFLDVDSSGRVSTGDLYSQNKRVSFLEPQEYYVDLELTEVRMENAPRDLGCDDVSLVLSTHDAPD